MIEIIWIHPILLVFYRIYSSLSMTIVFFAPFGIKKAIVFFARLGINQRSESWYFKLVNHSGMSNKPKIYLTRKQGWNPILMRRFSMP